MMDAMSVDETGRTMDNTMIWSDCGTCGRTHEASGIDCRAFVTCTKCGDAFHVDGIVSHLNACDGKPLSGDPNAQWEDIPE